jgi:ribosomal protein S27AE
MKKCKLCNQEKDIGDFYKGSAKCKPCYIEIAKRHRANNAEYYREYDKKRANLPHRVSARERYSKTDSGIKSSEKAKLKWNENNLLKRAANIAIGNAIRDGKLIKPRSCSECHTDGVVIHGHHDDYAYPLSVRWLCSKCHRLWHKENGSAINSNVIENKPANAGFLLSASNEN